MERDDKQIFCEDDKEHIFRFRLEPSQDVEGDPLTELIRTQLGALLDTVVLCSDGHPVEVEGFRFINSSKTHPIWPQL